jgi:hypothetical protein
MLNRRHLLQLAAATLACGLTGGSLAAQQAKTATVTLTIEGMT